MAEKGSVFQQWHEAHLKEYIQVLRDIIEAMERLPAYPFFVTEHDKRHLMMIAGALDVDISDEDLSQINAFYRALGKVKAKALSISQKTLRPEDPLLQKLESIRSEVDIKKAVGDVDAV